MARKKKTLGQSNNGFDGFNDGLGGGGFDDGLGGGGFNDGFGGGVDDGLGGGGFGNATGNDGFDDGLGTGSVDDVSSYGFGDDFGNKSDDSGKRKKKGSGGGPLKAILAIVIIAALAFGGYLLFAFITGPSKAQCEELVYKLEASVKNLDLKTFASCLDNGKMMELNSISEIPNLSDEEKTHYFVQYMAGIGGNLAEFFKVDTSMLSGVMNMFSLNPTDYGFLPAPTRIVKCKIAVMGVNTVQIVLTIKKADGRAYIAGISMG